MISLRTCLEAPILPVLPAEDLGVKNRVKERGVMVGGLRSLLLEAEPLAGKDGELVRSGAGRGESSVGTFSCEDAGVCSAIDDLRYSN